MDKDTTPLNKKQHKRLLGLAMDGHQHLGRLSTTVCNIYSERLWSEYKTFATWLKHEYPYLPPSRLSQLADHAETVAVLGLKHPPPERVTRPLAGLTNSQKQATWTDAVAHARDTADGRTPTAEDVARFVSLHAPDGPLPPKTVPGTKEVGELVSQIRKAKLRARALGKDLGWLDGEALFILLAKAEKCARLAVPVDVCQECEGSGCTACDGLGGSRATDRDTTPATTRQEAVLKKRGLSDGGLSKKEASRRIDNLSVTENWGPVPTSPKDIAAELADNPLNATDMPF